MKANCPMALPIKRTIERAWLIDTTVVIVILASVAMVFGQVLHHEFLSWDDQTYITRNTRVQAGLSWDNLTWALTSFEATNWHPLTWLSLMLDVQVFGVSPGKHQLVNTVFHGLAASLLYVFLRRTQGDWLPSAIAALVFAIHPLRAESVAWLAERKDVLSAMFFMATLVLYAWYVKAPGRLRYALVTASFALGLMSKPMLVTLPCILLLLDVWPLGRISFPISGFANWVTYMGAHARMLVLEKLPWFVLALVSAMLTVAAQSEGNAVRTLVEISVANRVANALISYATYLGQLLFPLKLTFIYPFRNSWQLGQLALSVAALAAVTWAVTRKGHTKPYLVVGWAWYLVTLLPVIGLITVGGQAMADRYTYLPSIGILIILCWGLFDILPQLRPVLRSICVGGAGLAIIMYALLCYQQVGYWRNGIALASHAVRIHPDNFAAQSVLAGELANRGRLVEATEAAIEALRLGGQYPPVQGTAYITLGDVALRMGYRERAIEYWNMALVAQTVRGEAYFRLAVMALHLKNPAAAVEAIRSTLSNDHSGEYRNLFILSARELLKQGALEETILLLGELRMAVPNDAEVRIALADALASHERRADAVSELEDFLTLRPWNASVKARLAALRSSGA